MSCKTDKISPWIKASVREFISLSSLRSDSGLTFKVGYCGFYIWPKSKRGSAQSPLGLNTIALVLLSLKYLKKLSISMLLCPDIISFYWNVNADHLHKNDTRRLYLIIPQVKVHIISYWVHVWIKQFYCPENLHTLLSRKLRAHREQLLNVGLNQGHFL